MKGIVIEGLEDLPSLSSGIPITCEDTVRYMKRNVQGKMIRRTFVGTIVKIECKWALLTAEQFKKVHSTIRGKFFNVTFPFVGQVKKTRFYAGNISAQPFLIKEVTENEETYTVPKFYRDISFSIISEDCL